ncbi:HYC_CC_PP family protein [Mucilaginibacter glaciei]|uniref:Uncharacterized protein n=1 Tax=Mucilaginibacter glaciei TaxID=2772109 RepID=A0A926S2I0_9SPHI|nr:hypothetical protein [Mucilaginibacter glaciei]MBD1393867.1 hypothetical protein [Mucilaginibacter glaciei]
MIKKSGVILLAVLYAITAAGFALNLHYCGNTVASVKINTPAKSCAQPMAKTKMNCCKDAKLDVKVKDDHQAEQNSFLAKVFALEIPKLPYEDMVFAAQQALVERFFDRGPPDIPFEKISVYLKNCIFRI